MNTLDWPISDWAIRLRAGDQSVAQELWDRYYNRMVAVARKRLQGFPRRASDEEDVALSAFKSFCRAVETGRCPQELAPDGLWSLMMLLTTRKVIKLLRHESCLKRRPPEGDGKSDDFLLETAKGRELDPEIVACMADEYERLLSKLGDPVLKMIAMRKMEGYTNADIAGELDLTLRTIERKVQVIRERLENDP